MKKYLIYIITLLLLGGCQHGYTNKKLSAIKSIPSFKMLSVDSSLCISSENIPEGYPTIFMYFDPECEHCQLETERIMHHFDSFRHVKIFMITANESRSIIKQFQSYYHIDVATNFFVGQDYQYSFYRAYMAPSVPYIAIYDSHRKLKRVYQGETNVRSLIAAIQE